MKSLDSYRGSRVLVTGHTGFKGCWLTLWLLNLEAKVTGFSLPHWPNDRLFTGCRIASEIDDLRGDVRSLAALQKVIKKSRPRIIFHLAAQTLVTSSYLDPMETWSTNLTGVTNVLEAARYCKSVEAIVIITSDKCYRIRPGERARRETDPLGGYDPYSASKAAAEIAVESFRNSFYAGEKIASVRAGNVIGGGDFSQGRIIPDCIRALEKRNPIPVKHPDHIRPWQHVLDPLYGYLLVGKRLMEGKKPYASSWNFGPNPRLSVPVSKLVHMLLYHWGSGSWQHMAGPIKVHEARQLALSSQKAHKILGWRPALGIQETVARTVAWYLDAPKIGYREACLRDISDYSSSLRRIS